MSAKYLPCVLLAAFLVHSDSVPYAEWMRTLMQPHRSASCCGPGDQYWVKEYVRSYRVGVAFVAVVYANDEQGDTFTVDVPPDVVIWDRINPTGRGVIFIARGDDAELKVLCFVPGTGA